MLTTFVSKRSQKRPLRSTAARPSAAFNTWSFEGLLAGKEGQKMSAFSRRFSAPNREPALSYHQRIK